MNDEEDISPFFRKLAKSIVFFFRLSFMINQSFSVKSFSTTLKIAKFCDFLRTEMQKYLEFPYFFLFQKFMNAQ